MAASPKRTLAELKARYEYEPAIQDVFVEGYFDVDFVRWFLDCIRVRDVEVYPIETVEIPPDLPDGIGPEGGNRTRLIRLANAFDKLVPDKQLICIIDSDYDLIGVALDPNWPMRKLRHLLQTDVTAMEMYVFSFTSIAKLIRLVAKNHVVDISAMLTDMGQVLRQIFAVRCASVIYGFNFHWIDFTGCCSEHGAYASFDQNEFINRLLNKNAAQLSAGEFRDRVTAVASRLPSDPRFSSQGHDFFRLLRWVLRVHGIFPMSQVELFERIVISCVELSELRSYDFWRNIESCLDCDKAR